MISPVEGWTEGRFNSFIVSTLRAGVRRFPNKWKALEAAAHGVGLNEATGRKAKLYFCNHCAKLFTAKHIQIDHITPVVDPVVGFTTWDDYISRLFCEIENLQALCLSCHKLKTAEEKQTRTGKALRVRSTKTPLKTSQKPRMRTHSCTLKKPSRVRSGATKSGVTSPAKQKKNLGNLSKRK